jgi:hypothetical protein
MSDPTEIAARAMQTSKAWPVVFQAGSAGVLARAAVEAIEAAGFVIVPAAMWFRPDDDKQSDV